MFSFFKKPKPRDDRDIEQILSDLAGHADDKDFEALFERMKGRQVFVPADPASFPARMAVGEKYVTQAGDRVSVSTVTGPNGDVLLVAATDARSHFLKAGYLLMDWADFIRMAARIDPSISGALLQGTSSFVVLDRQRIGRQDSGSS